MVNQFGNKFECEKEEVKRYLQAFATFEDENEKAKYEKEEVKDKVEQSKNPKKQ